MAWPVACGTLGWFPRPSQVRGSDFHPRRAEPTNPVPPSWGRSKVKIELSHCTSRVPDHFKDCCLKTARLALQCYISMWLSNRKLGCVPRNAASDELTRYRTQDQRHPFNLSKGRLWPGVGTKYAQGSSIQCKMTQNLRTWGNWVLFTWYWVGGGVKICPIYQVQTSLDGF
jgi:hypothetical protein